MEWLNDKKNLPIVATIVSVLIIVAAFVVWTTMFKGSSGGDSVGTESAPIEASAPQDTGIPTPTNTAPAPTNDPAANPPGATAGSAGANTATAAVPMESWRKDPFMPLGYNPPSNTKVKVRAPIPDLPLGALFPARVRKSAAVAIPEPPQPPRRMAGLLQNGRIFAIIESNGKTEIVQPGDTLSDRLAVVEKIERDRVILKTTSENPRYIVVRMAAAASTPGSASPATSTPGRRTPNVPRPGTGGYGSPSGPMQQGT